MRPHPLQDLYSHLPAQVSIASLLHKLAMERTCLTDCNLTLFDAECIPPISVEDYLVRIQKLSQCSNENMVTALALIDRLIEKGSVTGVTFFNVH